MGFPDTSAGDVNSCLAGEPSLVPGSGNPDLLQKGQATQSNILGPLCGSAPACRDLSMTPGFGRSPGEGKGCPLQYSCLHNSMDPIVYGVANSRTGLKDLSLHFQERSAESGLDWSLPVPSGISSLKPAKTHTLAFAGSPLRPLDRKTSMVPQAHR